MPTRGSSSTVRPTPTCQTTSWPCSSHSPTTRPPTGNRGHVGARQLHPQPRQRQRTSVLHTRKYRERNHERARRTPPITRHRQTPRRSRRTRTRHRRRQPQPAKPLARRTRAASAIRDLNKGHTLQQIRGFLITDEDRRSALAHLRGELQTSPAMKKLLLIRANEQKAGYRITRPRSLKALPIMPEQVSAKSDFALGRSRCVTIGQTASAIWCLVRPMKPKSRHSPRMRSGATACCCRKLQTFSADGRARQYRRMHAADAAIPAG